ncbi:MAG: glycine reductase, partial [Clostridiales Family XIII bacterium]|nr:glycine reductase [Clostridiales Family XIII bacterium]
MSRNAVIKASSYILVHGPDFVIHNGTTQTTERIVNPNSEYLAALPGHIRSFESAVSYPPNQVYIGNLVPEDLRNYEIPWYDKEVPGAKRFGKLGEIMPQDEFLGLMQICDVFDLVFLDKEFVNAIRGKLSEHPLMDETLLGRLKEGVEHSEIVKFAEEEHAEPLYHNGKLVGYVKRAHDIDAALTAHVILENLVYKATGVLTLLHLINNSGIAREDVDYVIDCSEEAC